MKQARFISRNRRQETRLQYLRETDTSGFGNTHQFIPPLQTQNSLILKLLQKVSNILSKQ